MVLSPERLVTVPVSDLRELRVSSIITKVDTEKLESELEERGKLSYLKPEKIEFQPKHKTKGKNKAGKLEKRKKGVIEERKKEKYKEINSAKKEVLGKKKKKKNNKSDSVLDRFL